MVGRPMSPANRQFQSIPRTIDGCIYAAELSNGVIKVGFSRNPRTRMCLLAKQARVRFGARIVAWRIGSDMPPMRAMAIERALIQRMARIATPFPKTIEFFQNVRFGVAAALVRQLSRPTYTGPDRRSKAR